MNLKDQQLAPRNTNNYPKMDASDSNSANAKSITATSINSSTPSTNSNTTSTSSNTTSTTANSEWKYTSENTAPNFNWGMAYYLGNLDAKIRSQVNIEVVNIEHWRSEHLFLIYSNAYIVLNWVVVTILRGGTNIYIYRVLPKLCSLPGEKNKTYNSFFHNGLSFLVYF